MKRWTMVISTAMMLALAAPLTAQSAEEEEPGAPYIYASFFECESTAKADAAVWNPEASKHWEKAVADGKLLGWDWWGHHTGGTWRRSFWSVGADLPSLLAALDELSETDQAADPDDEFGKACPRHEDYIWRHVTGSDNVGEDGGDLVYSTFFECQGDEDLADSIVETRLKPALDAMVGNGLTRWGWAAHVIGGKYRRVLVAWGDDFATLVGATNSGYDTAFTDHEGLGRAFGQACASHQDYVWADMSTPPAADEE